MSASTSSTDSIATTTEDGTTPTPGENGAQVVPVETPDTTDYKAEAEKWKNLSRKNEEKAKANLSKAQNWDSHEASKLSDQERAAAERETLQSERAELALARAALKFGLSEADAELVGTHGTPDEILGRAERLAKRLKAAVPVTPVEPVATVQRFVLPVEGGAPIQTSPLNGPGIEDAIRKALNIQEKS